MREVDAADSDAESSVADETEHGCSDDEESIEYNESDLPTQFLGTAIQRQIMTMHGQRRMQPRLRINTTAGAAVSNPRTADRANNNNGDNVTQPPPSNDDNSAPPSPWGSSKAKQRIIDELKDEESDIHLLIGSYTTDNFDNVNFKRMQEKYTGNKYKPSNFKENIKRQLRHLLNGTGDFKAEEAIIEPWYTSVNKVSKAYLLLFSLHMGSKIDNMTEEEIWESDPLFQQYELEPFKTYNKNMKKLTNKRKGLLLKEEESYQGDMLKLPRNTKTSRGVPFWNNHGASELLKEDVRSGNAQKMKPRKLWESREEYQCFPLRIFRKHIYQERTKQLAAPYWQDKRNKNARKKYEDGQELMKKWHDVQNNREIDGMIGNWGRINLGIN